MQRLRFFGLLLFTLCPASFAFGHGFTLQVVNNTIVPTGSNLFTHVLTGANDASHGGINATHASFSSPALNIDFLGGLWFSDGGPAVPASTSMFAVNTVSNEDATIAGNSGPQAGFPVVGASSHEILWALLGANPTPGVYGLAYSVAGSGSGGPYVASQPLVVAFHTSNFDTSPNLAAAQAAVFAAAVPEPSSIALLGMSAATLAVVRRRLRSRRA